MRLMYTVLCLAPLAAWAQPAKVIRETTLHSGADGEIKGRLPAGTGLQVLSRVTTETGTWCRVQGPPPLQGSLPCRDLAISQPEPPRMVPGMVTARPMLPPSGKAAQPGKPRSKPSAPPPPELLVAPTAAEMRKIMPGLGDVRTTQPVDPINPAIVQEYKFSDNDEAGVLLWIRPTGESLGSTTYEIRNALSAEMTRVQRDGLFDGRPMRVGKTEDGVMATGVSPAGDYQWTMVYLTTDSLDDVQSQVVTAARQIDRLLFQ